MSDNETPQTGSEREPDAPPEPPESSAPEPPPAAPEPPPVQAPPPPVPARPIRRLTRRREGKILGGVTTGLAAYTGLDPVLFRIGFVVLTLMSGVGIVAYIVAWIVMPRDDGVGPPAPPPDAERTRKWIGIAALVAGAALLIGELWPWRSGVVWGLLLVGVGVALWSRDPRTLGAGPDHTDPTPGGGIEPFHSPDPADPFPAGVPGSPGGATSSYGGVAPARGTLTAPPGPPSPPRRRERSALARYVAGAAALTVGVVLVLDAMRLIRADAFVVMTILLFVVGAGLVVGAWWGRARRLIIPGVLLTLVLIPLSVAPPHVRFRGGFGEVRYRPTSLASVRPAYRLGAGQLTVDLSQVSFEGTRRVVRASVGVGEVVVRVPEDTDVQVRARIGVGEMNLFGRVDDGGGLRRDVRVSGTGEGLLILDLRVGMGGIDVRRGADFRDRFMFPVPPPAGIPFFTPSPPDAIRTPELPQTPEGGTP